jgi:hypothetical protein
MKQRFQRGDPDVFNLAWLDDQELEALRGAMLSNGRNEICAYWLRPFNEQSAIHTGKLGSFPAPRPETRTSTSFRSANLMQRDQYSVVWKINLTPL